MSSLFLSRDEVQDLTGYAYPKSQRAWLTEQGIPFLANRLGQPKVKRCLFTQIEQAVEKEIEPNFGALDE